VNWAFSDESERGSLMLFGMMTVSTAEVVRARKELRALLLPGQRRVHTAKESPPRRRQLLDVVGGLDVEAIVLPTGCSTARTRCRPRETDARSIMRSPERQTFLTTIGRATTSRCFGQSTQSSGLSASVVPAPQSPKWSAKGATMEITRPKN
jgi:hypothetical protein